MALDKEQAISRMAELMEPIDRQIMMCDNVNDLLLLASIMLTTCKTIYTTNIGSRGAGEVFKLVLDEINERIVPIDREGRKG